MSASSESSSDDSVSQLFEDTNDHSGLFCKYIEDTLEVPFWFLKERPNDIYEKDLIEVLKVPSTLGSQFAVQDFVDVRSPIIVAPSSSDVTDNEFEVLIRSFTLLFDLSASLFFTEFQDEPLDNIKQAAINQLKKLTKATGFIIPKKTNKTADLQFSAVFAALALCFSLHVQAL